MYPRGQQSQGREPAVPSLVQQRFGGAPAPLVDQQPPAWGSLWRRAPCCALGLAVDPILVQHRSHLSVAVLPHTHEGSAACFAITGRRRWQTRSGSAVRASSSPMSSSVKRGSALMSARVWSRSGTSCRGAFMAVGLSGGACVGCFKPTVGLWGWVAPRESLPGRCVAPTAPRPGSQRGSPALRRCPR